MNVSEVSTAELAGMAAPYNPRKISKHDLEALRRSLKLFGTVEPIVVNKRSGHIVGGHQRVRAAEAEGIESLPVVHVDLDEPNERQLNLALNRISGEWDLDKLALVLGDLEAAGADLAFTGFTDVEIEQLVQLIALGDHRLLCGDSTNEPMVQRLMDGRLADAMWTDPPYGVSYTGKTTP